MRVFVFTSIVIAGITTISGCSTAQKFTSNVDPNAVSYNSSASKNVNDIYMAYSECLSSAFVRISKQRIQTNDLPDMKAKIYEDQCIREERLLYQALYSAARDYDPKGPEKFARDTAVKGVTHVKKITFEAISEGFQPPK